MHSLTSASTHSLISEDLAAFESLDMNLEAVIISTQITEKVHFDALSIWVLSPINTKQDSKEYDPEWSH